MLTLIEELSLRTRRVQAMMRQMEDTVERMDQIRRQLRRCSTRRPPATSGRISAASFAT